MYVYIYIYIYICVCVCEDLVILTECTFLKWVHNRIFFKTIKIKNKDYKIFQSLLKCFIKHTLEKKNSYIYIYIYKLKL